MGKIWKVSVWGVRGSFPAASAEFMQYGGNTSCISVDCGDDIVIFDAGSGLAQLSNFLLKKGVKKRIHLLLSHLHIDHIMGLFSFQMLYDPKVEICIYGEGKNGISIQELLGKVLRAPYYPWGVGDIQANLHIYEVGPKGRFQLSGNESLKVRTMRGNHPDKSLIYRLESAGKSVVYALDCEIDREIFMMMAEFARDTELLIWDANFTEDDLQRSWGHSTWEQGIAMRQASGAKMVLMTHYNWEYTDKFLYKQERLATQIDAACYFAREGIEMKI